MKIKISGYSAAEGCREFEILERERIEEIITELNPSEVFLMAYKKAEGYPLHSGNAYVYIDARDGSVNVDWISKSSWYHPWDSFYRIWLFDFETGDNFVGHYFCTADYLLDEDEFAKWEDAGRPSLEEFLGEEEFQRQLEMAVEAEALMFDFNWDKIRAQLDELYQR